MIPAPTRPEDRIDAIDIVRGFVLFGVLIVNAWGTLAGPPITNPNRVDWILNRLINGFFNYRSMATFSLLFGLGLAMQSDKARADGSSFAGHEHFADERLGLLDPLAGQRLLRLEEMGGAQAGEGVLEGAFFGFLLIAEVGHRDIEDSQQQKELLCREGALAPLHFG